MANLAHRKEIMPSAIIVGAGWAGLNCAYELSKAGYQVQIIEAAPQIGGRARAVNFADQLVDNGQHIAIGAYKTLRDLLQELNLNEPDLFKILPFELIIHGAQTLKFKLPKLSAPYNFFIGLLLARQISWHEKFSISKFYCALHKNKFKLVQDCSVLDLLKNYHQTDFIITHLWEPIALAAMSTPVKTGSAQIFLNILQQLLHADRSHSDWYLPAVDLSELLPNHLAKHIQQNGGQIIHNQRINAINVSDNACVGINSNNQSWFADHIILATPAWCTAKLLQQHSNLQTLSNNLMAMTYEAITTLYFLFAEPIELQYPIVGMVNTTSQWIFDRAFSKQNRILSVIITGNKTLEFTDKNILKEQILSEIRQHIPHLPDPIASKIICEKRAAFSCDINSQNLRPTPITSINNLWITGDYLQTGLPATLEGALLSGKLTAQAVMG